MPKIQERDKRKDELLKNLGYKIYRFSGHEIVNFSDKQLRSNLAKLLV